MKFHSFKCNACALDYEGDGQILAKVFVVVNISFVCKNVRVPKMQNNASII